MIKILSPRTSQSAIALAAETGIARTFNGPRANRRQSPDGATFIVNWGLAGNALTAYYQRWPDARSIPTMNKYYPGNKYHVNQILANDIPVPDTRSRVSDTIDEAWIYKPFFSRGGHGIERITQRNYSRFNWDNGYAQKEVTNRRYEVRVSCFNWLPREEWGIWKKTNENPENLTWNHEQGGRFETVQSRTAPLFVRCMDHSEKIMRLLNMQFCAIDFIVDQDWHEMMLEINMRPGFDELGKPTYANALTKLAEMPLEEQLKLLIVHDERPQSQKQAIAEEDTVESQIDQSAYESAVRAALEGFMRAGMTRQQLVNIANNM